MPYSIQHILAKFNHKFGTTIKHDSLWKWVMSKPSFLGDICNLCSHFIGYCAILNHPLAGSIIVRHHNLSKCFPFQGIVYGKMRSTHSVSQGFVSACLGVSLPYFWLVYFALWQVQHFLHMSLTVVRRPFQSKFWQRVCSVRVSPRW